MPLFDILLAILICALWGANFVAVKVGVAYIPPLCLMSLRFLFAGILFLPWVLKIPRAHIPQLLLLAITMGSYFGLLFIGMQTEPAGEAAILIQAEIPFAAIMAMYFFKERLSQRACVGMVIAFVGLILTVGMPSEWGSVGGAVLLLVSALMCGLYNNQVKKAPSMHPFALNGFVALVTCPFYAIASYYFEHPSMHMLTHAPLKAYGAFAYILLVSTCFCYSLWYVLLKKHAVYKIVPFLLLMPLFAILTGCLFLGEKLQVHTVLGGFVCALGLALIVVKRNNSQE